MMLRNDSERGLFNGDQGLVLNVVMDSRERLMAIFPAKEDFAVFNLERRRRTFHGPFSFLCKICRCSVVRFCILQLLDARNPL